MQAETINIDVLQHKRRILGRPDAKPNELRAAENPLDTAAARGWLEPRLAQAGHAYAALYRSAGLSTARVTASIEEAPETSGVDARRIQDMTPEEIAEVWRIVEQRQGFKTAGDGDAVSTARLHALWAILGPARCAELYAVCVEQLWPAWLAHFIDAGHRQTLPMPPRAASRGELLFDGLKMVKAFLTPPKPVTARDHPFLSNAPVTEETVLYVDDAGQPDPVRTRSGTEVIVVRRRRG